MKRREFLVGSAAALSTSLASPGQGRAEDGAGKTLLELRTYRFASTAKRDAFAAFQAKTGVPAFGRAGVGLVGVFQLLPADNPDLKADGEHLDMNLWVLLPHKSAESFLLLPRRLGADRTLREEGAVMFDAPKSDPAFVRFEDTLLLAFDAAPKVEVPTRAPGRLLQLRIYESHSAGRALKKIEMFNEGGEIAIFRRCGMTPVFFGQTLAGSRLPNLHYMLAFEDKAAMDKAWGTFRSDPAWIKLKDDPAYQDTVSNVTNLVLRPTAASEI